MIALKFILLIIASYFIGNISIARILSHLKGGDITKQGSGNPGTMNIIRNYGIKLGVVNLFLDCLKGAIPALAGFYLLESNGLSDIGLYVGGYAAVIGHMWPVCYKFKGGKSVACALGVFCVASPVLLLSVFFGAILYLYFFDYGAVFSFIVLTIVATVEAVRFSDNIIVALLILAIYFTIIFAHRSNIFRLLIGKENKVNFKGSLQKMIAKSKAKKTKKELKEEDIS